MRTDQPYKTQTIEHKSVLKRFSHSRRFEIALRVLDIQEGESVLDFGTGDGHMLNALLQQGHDCEIVGYEPVPSMYSQLTESLANEIRGRKLQVSSDMNRDTEPAIRQNLLLGATGASATRASNLSSEGYEEASEVDEDCGHLGSYRNGDIFALATGTGRFSRMAAFLAARAPRRPAQRWTRSS